MLVISTTNTPPSVNRIIGVYLFKIDSGVWVGEVTRRVLDHFLDVLPSKIGKGRIILAWSNRKISPKVELFEFSGVGELRMRNIDGINFLKV